MLLLVNNLMDIQKYEAGQYTLQKRQFEFNSFIKEIQRSFESIASSRQITFSLNNFLPYPWYVCYDEKEIEKVLFNLLSNAFKFTAPRVVLY
ncbi:MAG: hypothetical protein LUE98_17535 [Tannerellaceae bacterium]|nr:hypothetical protein [Tannerellaceae bacterium]